MSRFFIWLFTTPAKTNNNLLKISFEFCVNQIFTFFVFECSSCYLWLLNLFRWAFNSINFPVDDHLNWILVDLGFEFWNNFFDNFLLALFEFLFNSCLGLLSLLFSYSSRRHNLSFFIRCNSQLLQSLFFFYLKSFLILQELRSRAVRVGVPESIWAERECLFFNSFLFVRVVYLFPLSPELDIFLI